MGPSGSEGERLGRAVVRGPEPMSILRSRFWPERVDGGLDADGAEPEIGWSHARGSWGRNYGSPPCCGSRPRPMF